MNISSLKAQIAAKTQKTEKKTYEKIDYSKYFFKPQPGTYNIRILPSKFNKDNPFREIYVHYGFTKYPLFALTNWDEQDPIVEKSKEVLADAKKTRDKEDYQLGKKLEPKARYFTPVLVRGQEDRGAVLWEIGIGTLNKLIAIADNEDYGDYTDINDGRDLVVEFVKVEKMGKTINECQSILPRGKSSPITSDAKFLDSLLENQPDILEFNRKHTYEQISEILMKWLNPEDETNTEAPIVSADKEEEEDHFLQEINAPVTKTNSADKFNSLFVKK